MPGRAGEDRGTSTATTPSSSRSTPSPSARSRSRELGHLKKFGVGAHRKLVEFRGGIDGAVEGESVTVETFAAGR